MFSQMLLFSALRRTFYPVREKRALKQDNQSDFKALDYRKMKGKENQCVVNFATFVSKTLLIFPVKMKIDLIKWLLNRVGCNFGQK